MSNDPKSSESKKKSPSEKKRHQHRHHRHHQSSQQGATNSRSKSSSLNAKSTAMRMATSTTAATSTASVAVAGAAGGSSTAASSTARRSKNKSQRRSNPKPVRPPFVLDRATEAFLKSNSYTIKERLGLGAFSEVLGAYSLSKELDCAVKVIDLSMMNEKYHTKFLPRELKALSEVRHQYIIQIYDIFRVRKRIFIFMERAGKDLARFLKELHKPMEEKPAAKWFAEMTGALLYMHVTLKMAHRDIKIDNLLLVEETIKLTDFGFSICVLESEENEPRLSTTFCGTRPYLSPQIVSKQAYSPFKADIWALGVVLFAMLNNKYPYHYKDRKRMLQEHRSGEYINGRFNDSLSLSAKELMLAMFTFEEEERIDIEKIVEHEWLLSNCDKESVVSVDD